jgi:pimeloyl-ACP methyl ester carboxylesterase
MSTVTSADGTRIAYDRVGDGPPLITVAGATAYRAVDQTTPELARRLAEGGHAVISYDRRGRGESGDTLPYAPEREIEDIEALVAEAGGEASLFGMSSGAVLAVEAAARGVAVSRLVMYEPPCRVDDTGPYPKTPQEFDDYLATLDAATAAGRPGDAMAHFMEMVGMSKEEVEAFRGTPGWPAFEAVGHTIAYDGRIMEPFSRGGPIPPGRWEAALQPTLVLDGGDSPEWMRNAAAAVAAAVPNAEARTLPGQTHQFDPGVLAPVMLEFLGD